ncbi:glutaredoxin family protein [Chitiniphilus eburneus]|uniref:Glutaredoxin family protein n=1 Tax=Chitiniphilus eburneus TaxID=2571148 RepID=A0A4U0Q5S0_9NEIS|nr:glutaredoxin family protein [Chitiniphilus eburneus]TJZ75522.1 glutaredoxin family protein [Chitiniphilus eburneus]
MNRPAILLILAIVASAPALAAKVYQWRDADGNVFYSDRPPPGNIARERTIKPNVIGSSAAARPQPTRTAAAKAVIYVFPQCVPCDEARAFLDANKVPYEVVSTDEGGARVEDMVNRAGVENLAPPVLELDGQFFKGWQRDTWSNALKLAGYPLDAAPAAPR